VTVGELRTYPQYSWETELRLGQSSNYFDVNSGTFEFRGNSGSSVDFREDIEVEFRNYGGVDFDTDVEFTSTVTAQTPTEDDEVANKAYVDGVVVPPGGLVAWPEASGIPTGWSDAGLSSPMTDYIWIRKD
ncbi:MAG: hypothetical protein VXU42_00580, partial [Verrucomicrobiota bacterium]|nr:hypothetical protein [Verrucomicrobiota bacterium]